MTEPQQNIKVGMIRENLEGIPEYPLPDGFRIEWYKKGYQQHWVQIHKAAEKFEKTDLQLFTKEFGTDEELLTQRQCFLFDENRTAVDTAGP